MPLTSDATLYFSRLVEAFKQHAPPNYRVWMFDKGREDAVHDELCSSHLIERWGTTGSGWRLTDLGHELLQSKIPTSAKGTPMSSLEEKQRARFRVLRAIYESTDGNTDFLVMDSDLEEVTGLTPDALRNATNYLSGEGLLENSTLNGVSIAHAGVVEYEATLAAAEGRGEGSDYFPIEVVQPVINQHFHAPVGSVQTGANATANVTQNIGASSAEIVQLLSQLEHEIASDTSPSADAARDLIATSKQELSTPHPNWDRVKSLLSPLLKIVTTAAGAVLAEYAKKTLGLPP